METVRPERTSRPEDMYGLQQTRLAAAIRANDQIHPWRKIQLDVSENSERPNLEGLYVHGRTARRPRNGIARTRRIYSLIGITTN